jgi:predicted TPR repeat methyltransferase
MKDKNLVEDYYKKTVIANNSDTFEDFLKQVGKTYLGNTINEKQFEIIIKSILQNLQVTNDDNIIDLGCANGLISCNIAKYSKEVFGFDLSKDLIRTANKYNKSNTIYQQKNILEVNFKELLSSKIYMYEVLQHLEYNQLRLLLQRISNIHDSFTFFIGSIPDMKKVLDFYNTKERKKYYFNEVLENDKFHIGNWWYKEQIQFLCEDLGFKCKIIEQDKSLHTAHYRFDCLIEKR